MSAFRQVKHPERLIVKEDRGRRQVAWIDSLFVKYSAGVSRFGCGMFPTGKQSGLIAELCRLWTTRRGLSYCTRWLIDRNYHVYRVRTSCYSGLAVVGDGTGRLPLQNRPRQFQAGLPGHWMSQGCRWSNKLTQGVSNNKYIVNNISFGIVGTTAFCNSTLKRHTCFKCSPTFA